MIVKTGNPLAVVVLIITIGSFARSVFDHVGWNFLNIFSVSNEILRSVADEFIFNFMFINSLISVIGWAVLSSDKGE